MRAALDTLGIRPTRDIPADVLLDEHFNGSLYGLDSGQMEKVRALRDIVAAYGRARSAPPVRVNNARDAAAIVLPMLEGISHEEVIVIFLTTDNTVILAEPLFKGTTDSVNISPRDIVSRALCLNAASVVLTHNHPSGNPSPGTADIRQTEAVSSACKVFGISLIDHVIVSRTQFFSFADERKYEI